MQLQCRAQYSPDLTVRLGVTGNLYVKMFADVVYSKNLLWLRHSPIQVQGRSFVGGFTTADSTVEINVFVAAYLAVTNIQELEHQQSAGRGSLQLVMCNMPCHISIAKKDTHAHTQFHPPHATSKWLPEEDCNFPWLCASLPWKGQHHMTLEPHTIHQSSGGGCWKWKLRKVGGGRKPPCLGPRIRTGAVAPEVESRLGKRTGRREPPHHRPPARPVLVHHQPQFDQIGEKSPLCKRRGGEKKRSCDQSHCGVPMNKLHTHFFFSFEMTPNDTKTCVTKVETPGDQKRDYNQIRGRGYETILDSIAPQVFTDQSLPESRNDLQCYGASTYLPSPSPSPSKTTKQRLLPPNICRKRGYITVKRALSPFFSTMT